MTPKNYSKDAWVVRNVRLDSGLAPQHVRIDAVDTRSSGLTSGAAGRVLEPFFSWQRPASFGSAIASRASRKWSHLRTHPEHGHGSGKATSWTRTLTDQALASVIFCRNLLIYLDAAARSRALRNARSPVNTSWGTILGYAETGFTPLTSGLCRCIILELLHTRKEGLRRLRPRSGARSGTPRPAAPASAFRLGSAAYTAWPRTASSRCTRASGRPALRYLVR